MGDMCFLVVRREGNGAFQKGPWLLWVLSMCCAEHLHVPIVGAVSFGRDWFACCRPNMGDMRYLFARQTRNAMVLRDAGPLLVLSTGCVSAHSGPSRDAGWSSVADGPPSLHGLTCFACLSPKRGDMRGLYAPRDWIAKVLGGSWRPLVLAMGFAGGHRGPIREAGCASGAAVACLPPMGDMAVHLLACGGSLAFGALPSGLKILRSPESAKTFAFRALDLVRLREKTSQLLHAPPGSHRALRPG